jgi:ABC-type phosphate transport system substrate-binding protein
MRKSRFRDALLLGTVLAGFAAAAPPARAGIPPFPFSWYWDQDWDGDYDGWWTSLWNQANPTLTIKAHTNLLTNSIKYFPICTPTVCPLGLVIWPEWWYETFPFQPILRQWNTNQFPTTGPLIAVPVATTAVAIPYNNPPVKSLTLTDDQLCGIFSGKLTSWDGLVPGGSGKLEVVLDSNPSELTYTLTQHFATTCNSGNSLFPPGVAPAYLWTHWFPIGIPAEFLLASGQAGIVSTVQSTSLALSYLAPGFTSVAPKSPTTTSLPVASVRNSFSGRSYLPTSANIELGMLRPGDNAQHTKPPSTRTEAANPLNWSPIIPQTTDGYPIIATINMLAPTCWSKANETSLLKGFTTSVLTNTAYTQVTLNAGNAPMPSPWTKAAVLTFVTNASKFNLEFNTGRQANCAKFPGR